MADTKRTVADMIANLFQDGQIANSITAQDLRDLVISLQPSYGSYSINVAAATNVAVASTYVKAAGTTTFDAVAQDMDDDSGTDNRIKYIGVPDRHFFVTAACTLTSSANNQTVGLKLAKNGVVIDDSIARRKINATTDVGAITLIGHADLSTNDYLEVWLTNETSTGSIITLDQVHYHVSGHIV